MKEEVQEEEWSEWYSGDAPVQHDGGSSGDAPVQHDAPMQDAIRPLNKVKKRGGKRLNEYNAFWGQKLQDKAKGKGVGKSTPAGKWRAPDGTMPKFGGYR